MSEGATGLRANAVLWAALLLGIIAAPALSQPALISSPADKLMTSPGGVDVRTGQYAYNETDLSIGGEGGLALTRTSVQPMEGYTNPFRTFSHNWDIVLHQFAVDRDNRREGTRGGEYYGLRVIINYGARSRTFDLQFYAGGNSQFEVSGYSPRALLTYTGSGANTVFSYTASDGTVVVFHPLGDGDCASSIGCAYASQVTEPDGTRYTLSYAGAPGGPKWLQRVVSSRGYALLFEGNGLGVSKACVLNLALTTLPSDNLCPTNVPTANYTYVTSGSNVGLASATGPDNATSSFTYTWGSGYPQTMSFIRPGETTPWLVNTHGPRVDYSSYHPYSVVQQSFADGQGYTYSVQIGPPLSYPFHYINPTVGSGYGAVHGGGVTARYDWIRRPGPNQPGEICNDPPCYVEVMVTAENGGDPRITFQQTPGPVEITLPMGRTTTFNYCDPVAFAGMINAQFRCYVDPLASFTGPDGTRTLLEHDGVGNIKKVTRIARPGSVQANGQPWPNIVTSATFDVNNIASQNKPLSMTDANNNTTNYTYSPVHGGMLTETGPEPTPGAPRPQTRHTYDQRYAWISNGSGGFVAAGPPIYLRISTSICRTSAASTSSQHAPCSVAGDEVLTQYDYGPNDGSQGNTLLLRGQTVTSTDNGVTTTLRTCYGYDALGRRISETQPSGTTNLTSCQ
jgi:YD repeat-containing protein